MEASLLREAGPFAGEKFDIDAEAVAAAVMAQDPSSDEEWAEAISAQIQGDYAQTTCEMMQFSADLGEAESEPTAGEEPEGQSVGTNHFAVVLDASGSMDESAGSGSRMSEAKGAVEAFVSELPARATVSLRVYGQGGDNTDAGKAESCTSSEVVFSGDPSDEAFGVALGGVEPVGWTPLAKGIADAQGDIPDGTTDAVMYVVSDGLETCGGDPVVAAQGVADSGVEPVINVIGFQVDDADQAALQAVADAGGGEYSTVESGAELEAYWAAEKDRWREAWVGWRDAEVERLQDTREAKVDEVNDLDDALRDEINDQKFAGPIVVRELNGEGVFQEGERAAVLGLLSEQTQGRLDYANEFSDLSFVVGDNYLTDVTDVYGSADNRWIELYQDSQNNNS